MTVPLLGRTLTCLGCLRRLAGSPIANSTAWKVPSTTTCFQQTRGKKKRRSDRPPGQIAVRLLDDIPGFGPKEAIINVARGRMRNLWYPAQLAEYMTPARFEELGLTKQAIVERDATFGVEADAEQEDIVIAPVVPKIELQTLAPERAHALLSFLVPETLTFDRKPIRAPTPPTPEQPRSPSLAPGAAVSTGQGSSSEATISTAQQSSGADLAIFGSVSTADVVARIKALLVADRDASRIALGPNSVRFVGLEDSTADRVKSLGRWEIELNVPGAKADAEPLRKVVEVIPGE